ncbi:MAG TPA: heme-binding domain-containing protein [Thermodesulfobacteriota bacterium]|nr:heme-binding domain-containing protein [Thermodesulfobacteriota bacterium]
MYLRIIAGVLIAAFIAIQFRTVERTNPPVHGDFKGPAEVKEVFQRACYDCHSNETKWPFYSYVAPFSWLVAKDVEEAREELNFSSWERTSSTRQSKKKKEIWKEVDKDKMPLWYYLPLHPGAKLSEHDKDIIRKWSRGML